MKENLHLALSHLVNKEANIMKSYLSQDICLKGYFDLSMMRYLNKVYDFEKELRKLKKLRMQLLDKSKLDKIGKTLRQNLERNNWVLQGFRIVGLVKRLESY